MAGLTGMLCLANAEAQALTSAGQVMLHVVALDNSSVGSPAMSTFAAEVWLGGGGS